MKLPTTDESSSKIDSLPQQKVNNDSQTGQTTSKHHVTVEDPSAAKYANALVKKVFEFVHLNGKQFNMPLFEDDLGTFETIRDLIIGTELSINVVDNQQMTDSKTGKVKLAIVSEKKIEKTRLVERVKEVLIPFGSIHILTSKKVLEPETYFETKKELYIARLGYQALTNEIRRLEVKNMLISEEAHLADRTCTEIFNYFAKYFQEGSSHKASKPFDPKAEIEGYTSIYSEKALQFILGKIQDVSTGKMPATRVSELPEAYYPIFQVSDAYHKQFDQSAVISSYSSSNEKKFDIVLDKGTGTYSAPILTLSRKAVDALKNTLVCVQKAEIEKMKREAEEKKKREARNQDPIFELLETFKRFGTH